MALNKSSRKYADADSDSSEHYYQNQQSKKISKKKKKASQDFNISHHNAHNHPHGFILAGSNSSGIASSTASSDRPLILRRKKFKFSYCLVIFAVFSLALSLISIAISFIFPFWINLSLQNESRNGSYFLNSSSLNITNFQSNISLVILKNDTSAFNVSQPIQIDLGIWEVKMHQRILMVDLSTNLTYSNNFPQSMLWLDTDSVSMESFLIQLLHFIELTTTNIFTVQILEILHIIFTLITLCFTSFTLCLCTSHKSSLCWYLVSFFMCLISFLTGLAVIVLIVVWQTSTLPNIKNQFGDDYYLERSFNWCFWLAVGINSAILLASLLILLYILIRTILLYVRNKANKAALANSRYHNEIKPSKLQNRTARLYQNGISIDDIDISNFSRLPRIPGPVGNPANISRSSTALAPSIQERLMTQNQIIMAHQQQVNTSIESMRSPSYIFYTGHGNYHKQEISLDQNSQDDGGVYKGNANNYDSAANDFLQPPSHLVNYSFISKSHHNIHSNSQNVTGSDHPYSNVVEQPDHKFSNYR